MCSSRCETPILVRGSWALAVRTQMPSAAERTWATRSVSTVTPFAAVVWVVCGSSGTVSIVRLPLLEQRLPGQPHPAALVDLEDLHLDVIALLDDILGALGAAVCQLGDVQQPFHARQDLDEGAEGGRALHEPLVHLADFGRLDHAGDAVARPLAALAHRGDRHQAVVVHVDLGAGLLLDA